MDHRSLTTSRRHRFDCPFGADEPYTLLLICRDPAIHPLDKQRIAYEIGATPCVNFCAWGHDAKAWELAVDSFCVFMDIYCGIDKFILTTEHSAEPVEDAVFFASIQGAVSMGHSKPTDGRLLIWFLLRSEPDDEDTALINEVLGSHYIEAMKADPQA